jgi:hypothetical protein
MQPDRLMLAPFSKSQTGSASALPSNALKKNGDIGTSHIPQIINLSSLKLSLFIKSKLLSDFGHI